jgi:hypothetical protein
MNSSVRVVTTVEFGLAWRLLLAVKGTDSLQNPAVDFSILHAGSSSIL